MMLEYMGWQEAADLIKKGIRAAIAHREVTYDLARMTDVLVNPPLKCSELTQIITNYFDSQDGCLTITTKIYIFLLCNSVMEMNYLLYKN